MPIPKYDFTEKYHGLHGFFEEQAELTPNAIAVEYESSFLTYKDLNSWTNRLAHYLIKQGIAKNTFVGILMDRSFETIVAMLATLKAGGAYVPLNPEHPGERLKFLADEIKAPIILTESQHRAKIKGASLVMLKENDRRLSGYSPFSPATAVEPDDLAYMIYTSGSTGKPKGCMNTHKGICNFMQWLKMAYPLTSKDKVLQKTSYSFDLSVPEIYLPLISGATLVIAKPGGHKDPEYLINTLSEKQITSMAVVPSMLQVLLENGGFKQCQALRIVFSSGEPLPSGTVEHFYRVLPKSKIINLYGPTEAAVECTFWECDPKNIVSPTPIGFPIPNNEIYILDETGREVSGNEYGELCIGGVQVAQGYWNRPDLTCERFVKDPFSKDPQAKMYKTGDIARMLTSGAFEIQGRKDFQVKIRGYRIELGEIEAALLRHQKVIQTAVIAKKLQGPDAPATIVAYVVAKSGEDLQSEEMQKFLEKKLPDYMVPSRFEFLNDLPTNSSGKIDRVRLMEQPLNSAHRFSAPIGDLEKTLASIWEQILKIKAVGRDGDFFALGGDSLGAMRAVHHIEQRGFQVSIGDLYAHPTIAKLAEKIVAHGNGQIVSLPAVPARRRKASEKFPLSSEQRYMNGPEKMITHILGKLDIDALDKSLVEMVQRHSVLRTKMSWEKDYQQIAPPKKATSS